MKLYKLSLMAFALTGVMAACSDDNKYEDAPLSPGAYFSSEAPEQVLLTEGASTVNVPILRTEGNGTQTYSLEINDESGLFTAPAQVTFEGDSKEANIVFTYDASKIVLDEKYACEIVIAEESRTVYGNDSYSFDFILKSPVIEEKLAGTYTYCNLLDGDDPDLPCYKIYSESNPDNYNFRIEHWFYDVPLEIKVNCDVTLSDGSHPVYVSRQFTGYTSSSYGKVYAVDYYTWQVELEDEEAENYINVSTFNPETGLFEIAMAYIIPDYGEGYYLGGVDYEYFQLDGFPEYGVTVTYKGIFTDADLTQTQSVIGISSEKDVEEVRVANAAGDASVAAQLVNGIISGEIAYETVPGNTNRDVYFDLPGSGDYTVVAVAFAGGEPQSLGYTLYSVTEGIVEKGNWGPWGTGSFVDGWVIPGYTNDGESINPFDFAYEVEIEKNLDYDGVIRLVSPYGADSGNLVAQQLNSETKQYNVTIDMSDPDYCMVPFQYSGYNHTAEIYITDAGYYYYANGYDPADVIAQGVQSYVEDNVIVVTLPLFLKGKDGTQFEAYDYPSEIALPSATPDQIAKAGLKRMHRMTSNNRVMQSMVQAKVVSKNLSIEKLSPRTNAQFKGISNKVK